MKENLNSKLKNRLSIDFKKVVLYKNPNEFTKIYIERVNPNHVGILWGRRHKKYNKGTHFIKFGRIFFGFVPMASAVFISLFQIDVLTNFCYMLLVKAGILTIAISSILTIIIYWLPFKMEERCTTYLSQSEEC